jgi:hypothetical protein
MALPRTIKKHVRLLRLAQVYEEHADEAKQLAREYAEKLLTAIADEYADNPAFQRELGALHNRIAALVGGRARATLLILDAKRRMPSIWTSERGDVDLSEEFPEGIYMYTASGGYEIVEGRLFNIKDYSPSIEDREWRDRLAEAGPEEYDKLLQEHFERREQEGWSPRGPRVSEESDWHLSPRLKTALDALGIGDWEPVIHDAKWTPHMEADQFGIKVSDEDALRIIDFLNANAREPTYE